MVRGQLQEPLSPSEVGVVIVTHNSENSIDSTLASISTQSYPPKQVVLVDSGSDSSQYLKKYDHQGALEMCFMPNIGFSSANNLGYLSLDASLEYVLFLNPDVIMPSDLIEKLIAWMSTPGREKIGACTPILLGWDLDKEKPTGLVDSTGIYTNWYGRWFDRGRGASAKHHPFKEMSFPDALCGAFMFCRRSALESVKLSSNQIFDERFFCYKEDIELSLRLKKKGWTLAYLPEFTAYHARGWNRDRSQVPHALKLMSANNELKIHLKTRNPIKIFYSYLKRFAVKYFNV